MFIVLVISVLLNILATESSDDEFRLLQDLRNDYDVVERPVANHNECVNLKIRVLLQQIMEIDEKNQMITSVIWLQQTWTDYKLTWDPAEYGNLTSVRIPADGLWKPDLILFNSADEHFDARFGVNFHVTHTGHVLHAPPAFIKSSCEMDITWFPYDEQICFLKYGSWTYGMNELNLSIDDPQVYKEHQIDIMYYVENGAWDLVATPAFRKVTGFVGNQYSELFFYMVLKRKTIYYGINWIVPSVFFLLCNILGFSLPAECGEKITLQTQNLLAMMFFLGVVSEVTPPTSTSVPLIGAFFALQILLLGSAVIVTILIINISFRNPKTHRMTPFLRSVFLEWVPWFCLMTRPDARFKRPRFSKKKSASEGSDKSSNSSDSSKSVYAPTEEKLHNISRLIRGSSQMSLANITKLLNRRKVIIQETEEEILKEEVNENEENGKEETVKGEANKQGEPAALTTQQFLHETLKDLREFLIESKKRAEEEDEEETEQADWRFMALAIDRLCMFIYTFLSIVLPVLMYLWVPEKDFVKMD